MDDLVRRAREMGGFSPEAELCSLMADEIELLNSEIERLHAGLRLITQTAPFGQPQGIARELLGEPWKPSAALGEKE